MDIQFAMTIEETNRQIDEFLARARDGHQEPLTPSIMDESGFLYRRVHEILDILHARGDQPELLPENVQRALGNMGVFLDWYIDHHL